MKIIRECRAIVRTPKKWKDEVFSMRVMSVMKNMGKKEVPYVIDGKQGKTFRAIVSQNDDSEFGEERVTEEVFAALEKGAVYEFRGTKRTTRDRGDRVIYDSIKRVANNDKAIME